MKYIWDYNLDEDWTPKTDRQWLWYLERKINYDDWQGLKKTWIQKYFPQLKERLDPGKRKMLETYFEFVHYDHPKLRARDAWNGIFIDSLDDIAANKLMAFFDRNEPKDTVDLYFLLTKGGYTIETLLRLVEQKFGVKFEKSSVWSEAFKSMKDFDGLEPFLTAETEKDRQILLEDMNRYFVTQSREFLDRTLE